MLTARPMIRFKQWKQTISQSAVKLVEGDTYPLAAFSQKVVCHYEEVCPFNDSLKQIEVNLGIQPNHYNHLFDVAVEHKPTSDHYQADEIDALLKGKHSQLIDEFRAQLAHPIFAWKIKRNKKEYRERVLDQVRFLAKQKYGALAYPHAYGGTGNMEGYANIFENLMYVDGSLTINLGYSLAYLAEASKN